MPCLPRYRDNAGILQMHTPYVSSFSLDEGCITMYNCVTRVLAGHIRVLPADAAGRVIRTVFRYAVSVPAPDRAAALAAFH